MTRPEDAMFVEDCGADAIGVVMFSNSPRDVSPIRAKEIFSSVGPFLTTVVVTHSQSTTDLHTILKVAPDAIQVSHGFAQVPGMRMIRVLTPGSPLREDCNAVVIDGSQGKGILFDQEYARKVVECSQVPVILAGGLTSQNVHKAIEKIRPYAVDVSTGVESAPGVKAREKIAAFVSAVRRQ